MVADSRRERWSPTATSTTSARLPVAWTPEGGTPRPRFGLPFDELNRRERSRKRRIFLGAGTAVLGVIALLAGFLLKDAPSNDVTTELQRALVLQSAGRLDEAAAIYRGVIADDPDSVVAYFNLGVVDHTQGQTQEAAANYVQVLALDPVYVPALFNLAILRAEEGDTSGAIGLYRRVIAVEPDNAGGLLNLGILLLQNGEEAEASTMISRAIELNPSLQQSDSTTPPAPPTTTPADVIESPTP